MAVLLFIMPALLVYTIIVFYPITQTVFRSMFEWDGIGTGIFIGFNHYIRLFKDKLFYSSVKNGIIVACILVGVQISLASLLALSLNDLNIKGKKILRTAYFIPVVLSVTVVCQLWMAIYNPQFGLLNKLFELLGLDYRQDWLSSTKGAIYAVAMVNAWQNMGYIFALLLAAIKSIPAHYYEAARIDGASKLQTNMKITIPLMAESYKLCFIMAITGGFNAFATMYVMTNGGPGTSTYTLTFMMYRSAFRVNEFGYGSATAVMLVLQCLVVTLIINKLIAREKMTY